METSASGNSQPNANPTINSNYNSEIIRHHEIKDTPFTIIETKEGCFGAIANHRITEFYEDIPTAKKETIKITWNRIIQVLAIIIEKTK